MTVDLVASLDARHAALEKFDRWDLALVRHIDRHAGAVHPRDEAIVRYALALARLVVVRTRNGNDFPVASVTSELRDRLNTLFQPAFSRDMLDTAALARAVPTARDLARSVRARLVVLLGERLPPADLERELTTRSLVLACGGGGGVGYAHLGAFALLESAGLRPALIAGSSMGSVMGLFRARALRFDVAQVPKIMGELETRRMFRPFSAENRYTLPSVVRLALREGIGPYFEYDGVPMRLRDLPIPLLITVAGIRRDALPHPMSYYENVVARARGAMGVGGMVKLVATLVRDMIRVPDVLKNVVLGPADDTRDFDVVDAAGFSSSVPGALHYSLAREAPTEADRIESLLSDHGLIRVTDGGVVDNVPAKTAWMGVQQGHIATRNAFILALDAFAPRLTTPLWLPIQRLAWENVKRSIPFAHHYFAFRHTLSPVDLLPEAAAVMRHVESAKRELIGDLPFIRRMLEPLPGVGALAAL